MRRLACVVVASVISSSALASETLVFEPGSVRTVDGDTLAIGKLRIRLSGIDAPETLQYCTDVAGDHYSCGIRAANYMRGLIGNNALVCEVTGLDKYKRSLGDCFISDTGDSVSESIVKSGWAVSYRKYSHQWDAAEADARVKKRGMWSGSFILPSEFRHPQH